MLELARRLTSAPGRPEVGIELLFTVCEEVALRGAKAFDASQLISRFGYVFDHASPIGEIVLASPTYYRIVADVHGRAAHAGIRPENGRSAIARRRQGDRGDAARAPRPRDDRQRRHDRRRHERQRRARALPDRGRGRGASIAARAEAVATEMVDHLQEAADAAECDLDVTVERMFDGYRTRPREPLGRARRAGAARLRLRAAGTIATGGGSDANALEAAGFPCANLANGTERNHEPDERVSVDALEGMLEVAIALVERGAGRRCGEAGLA